MIKKIIIYSFPLLLCSLTFTSESQLQEFNNKMIQAIRTGQKQHFCHIYEYNAESLVVMKACDHDLLQTKYYLFATSTAIFASTTAYLLWTRKK